MCSTISIHQDRCFPPGYTGHEDRGEGEGLGANLNVPAARRQRP